MKKLQQTKQRPVSALTVVVAVRRRVREIQEKVWNLEMAIQAFDEYLDKALQDPAASVGMSEVFFE